MWSWALSGKSDRQGWGTYEWLMLTHAVYTCQKHACWAIPSQVDTCCPVTMIAILTRRTVYKNECDTFAGQFITYCCLTCLFVYLSHQLLSQTSGFCLSGLRPWVWLMFMCSYFAAFCQQRPQPLRNWISSLLPVKEWMILFTPVPNVQYVYLRAFLVVVDWAWENIFCIVVVLGLFIFIHSFIFFIYICWSFERSCTCSKM